MTTKELTTALLTLAALIVAIPVILVAAGCVVSWGFVVDGWRAIWGIPLPAAQGGDTWDDSEWE